MRGRTLPPRGKSAETQTRGRRSFRETIGLHICTAEKTSSCRKKNGASPLAFGLPQDWPVKLMCGELGIDRRI
jgi:hypothetical protein